MKRFIFLLLFIPVLALAEPLYSPTWGFGLDLPEGYELVDGDGKDRFSFAGPVGLNFDIVVYNGSYKTINDLVNDVNEKIGNKGEIDYFDYHGKKAALIELNFRDASGYGLCVELSKGAGSSPPMLLALSYCSAYKESLRLFHFSALDSIIPSEEEKYYPGPIMEYSFPRGEKKSISIGAEKVNATVREGDAEAAQVLVEREFQIVAAYLQTTIWPDAWIRYYRMIFRDSHDRIAFAATALVQNWSGGNVKDDEAKLALAKKALAFVQGFAYERHPEGSDFVNLVTAVTEGRGDCDSRAMLMAVILSRFDIRSAIMVSPNHSHAMGLVDIPGTGARFEAYGTKWLVAETTDDVDIGLIAADVSDIESWLAIVFE